MKAQVQKVISNMKKDREEVGLSQGELARRAGCHLNTVYGLERGAHVPSLALTLRIASILESEKRRKVKVLSSVRQSQFQRLAKAS